VVGVGHSFEEMATTTIPTTTPEETMAAVGECLTGQWREEPFQAIGIASFGPIGVNAAAPDYGVIGVTPKAGWSQFNLRSSLKTFDVPITVDSDVNGAALAEATHGAGRGKDTVIYVTVGTGIGAGIVSNGRVSNGFSHPEAGHMVIPQHSDDLENACSCPFHDSCLEGLASGPSIMKRWQSDLSVLGPNHLGFQLEAHYLGAMCHNLIMTYMPDVILIGGGVLQAPGLIEAVRRETCKSLGGYLPALNSDEAMQALIQEPALAPISGLVGAYDLALMGLSQ